MGVALDAYKEAWSCTESTCRADLHERDSWVHVSWLSWEDAEKVTAGVEDGEIRRFCDSKCLGRWLNRQKVEEMAKSVKGQT